MNEKTFQDQARRLVFDYLVDRVGQSKAEAMNLKIDDIYVLSFSKVLLNWKAFISTSLPDDMRYEVTFDSSKNVAHIDAYKRYDNRQVSL